MDVQYVNNEVLLKGVKKSVHLTIIILSNGRSESDW